MVDDYANSTPEMFARVERIAGRFVGAVCELDLRDRSALSAVFDRHSVDAVLHFAARRYVHASAASPVECYDTNVGGTTALLRTMHEHGVHRLVFPSSCAVYGDAAAGLLDETTPVRPATPYASSKWICEQILADVCRHRPEYTVLCLRHLAVHTVAVRRVPPEEAALMQPAHGPERAMHPLVPGRQKAEPRHQQRRGVQGQGAVGLHEGTPAGVPALPAHLAVHLVPQGVPCAEGAVAAQQPPHPQGAVGGHPDHDLGVQDSSVNSTHLTPCTYGEKCTYTS